MNWRIPLSGAIAFIKKGKFWKDVRRYGVILFTIWFGEAVFMK